jgi:hypothetical protein
MYYSCFRSEPLGIDREEVIKLAIALFMAMPAVLGFIRFLQQVKRHDVKEIRRVNRYNRLLVQPRRNQ